MVVKSGFDMMCGIPRLFAMSQQNKNVVKEMDEWVEEVQKWAFDWQRQCFEWEVVLLVNLLIIIDVVTISHSEDVCIILCDEGCNFSVKVFYLYLSNLSSSSSWMGSTEGMLLGPLWESYAS